MIRVALLIFSILLPLKEARSAEIHRVDPPFWWTGFKQSQLQLMLYGDNISHMTVTVNKPGIAIDQVVSSDNPDYLFVYLNIESNAQPGEMNLLFKDKADEITLPYRLEQKSRDPDHVRGFSGRDTIYLITPDRFANGDPANDAANGQDIVNRKDPDARHGGDLEGIIRHLDYLAEMGFTAIWLNPVLENAMPSYSYHGYAITDLYRVDPGFGTNETYRDLAHAARRQGIGIIMDVVLNHIGSRHHWVNAPPQADWLNANGEALITNHAHTAIQDPYATPEDLRHLVDGWFVDTMADMNQRNPLLADYLIQNSLWWIEYLGLSGIRTDTYPYSDKHFLTRWSGAIMNEYPHFNIVGEEWHNNPAILSYWQRGKVNHDGYVSHLPSLMDFPLQKTLTDVLTSGTPAWGSSWRNFYELLSTDFLYPDAGNLVVFADNHDMSRIYTQLGEDYDLYWLALVCIATTRGIPQIFYGTEILMSNPGTGSHGVIRSDFPGGWPGDLINGFTGAGLSPQQKEAQAKIKHLFNWRKNKSVIHTGGYMHLHPRDNTYAYVRYNESDAVLVLLNLGDTQGRVSADRLRRFTDKHGLKWKDALTGEDITIRSSIHIPPRSPLILESVR